MKNYEEYEKQVSAMHEKNEAYLHEFFDFLIKKGLSDKTIKRHMNNVNFYINDFLSRSNVIEMEKRCYSVSVFLGDWFIRKAMWSTKTTIKETATSLKKFYNCMLDLNRIKQEDYDYLCFVIKEEMDTWIDTVEKYNDSNYDFFEEEQ